MMTHSRLVLAGCALIGLTACGSVVATSSSHPATAGASRSTAPAAVAARASAGVPLCAAARRLDQLEIRLTDSQPREILPRALTSTDAPRVRALAAALCGLSPLPGGLHCPATRHGALLLVFAVSGHVFAPVRIQDSGCPSVTGIGAAREWAWSSGCGTAAEVVDGVRQELAAPLPGAHPVTHGRRVERVELRAHRRVHAIGSGRPVAEGRMRL